MTTTTVLQLVEDVLLVALQTVWFVYDGILAYFSLHVKLFLDSILKLMERGKEPVMWPLRSPISLMPNSTSKVT
jgi:hypothetical protein